MKYTIIIIKYKYELQDIIMLLIPHKVLAMMFQQKCQQTKQPVEPIIEHEPELGANSDHLHILRNLRDHGGPGVFQENAQTLPGWVSQRKFPTIKARPCNRKSAIAVIFVSWTWLIVARCNTIAIWVQCGLESVLFWAKFFPRFHYI